MLPQGAFLLGENKCKTIIKIKQSIMLLEA